MTTWINSQFPRPDFHRQVQRHYGLQDTGFPPALGVGLPSGTPFRCRHRIKHRKRAPGQRGLRVGANLQSRNLDGNQIAWKYGSNLLFRDGVKRQVGKCDCLLEFTTSPELSQSRAESGHNSMWQNGLKILLRAIVGHGPKTGDLPSVWLDTCGSLPYQPDALVLMLRCFRLISSRGPVFLGETVLDDSLQSADSPAGLQTIGDVL